MLFRSWPTLLQRFGPLLALIILVIFTASCSDRFLSGENIFNVLRQNALVGILALGMTFVIILGGIDLSVGSLMALAGGLGIWTLNTAVQASGIIDGTAQAVISSPAGEFRLWLANLFIRIGVAHSEGWGLAIAFSLIVLIGILGGMLNGLLIARGRLAPFIVTLGTMAIFRSIIMSITEGRSFSPPSGMPSFSFIGVKGIILPFWKMQSGLPVQVGYPVLFFFALVVLLGIVLGWTRYGRYVIAIGCNEKAAFYSAINVNRIKFLTYSLMGLLTGIAAVLTASRFNSVGSDTGRSAELDAIAAVVIGGTSMKGGSGTILGTLVGVLILGVIGNMLNMLTVSTYLQDMVKGMIIIAAVLLQRGRNTE